MSENTPSASASDPHLLTSKLHSWLETSGRALEVRVTRRMREFRAEVRPSFAYHDVVSSSQREIDVVADFGWEEQLRGTPTLPCSLTAVVECKSSKKHPWVAFHEGSNDASRDRPSDWLAASLAPYTPVMDRLPALWIGNAPFTNFHPASHVVAARVGEQQSPKSASENDSNPANDAVRQVLAATEAERMRYIDAQSLEKRGIFVVPVVVTAAPLFDCRLTDKNEFELTPTDGIDVWGYRPSDGIRTRVYIRSEDAVGNLAKGLTECATYAGG